MKKLEFVVAGFVFLPIAALSQRVPSNDNGDSSVVNSSSVARFSRVMPISKMDQRRIYKWGNGQRSTPTGRQSGRRNVHYAKVFGDSAIVVSDPYANRPPVQRKPGTGRAFLYAPVIPIMKMDQRKIYNWANGQSSTPTGRQAYERNVNYAKVVGDSAIVVMRPH